MEWSNQQSQALTELKVCTSCGIGKPLDSFPPDRRALSGKQAKCRYCTNEWMKLHYRKHPAEQMLRRAKKRAVDIGKDFNLELEDILPLPEVCPVFGVPLRTTTMSQDPWTYSLDRVNNDLGYVKGNVVVMSYKANRLKNDGTAKEHEQVAAWMRQQLPHID